MSPRGLATAFCMPLVGYLIGKRWDERWLLAFGFGVAGIGFFGFSHMTLQSGTWDILDDLVTQGVGMAFLLVPLTSDNGSHSKARNWLRNESVQRSSQLLIGFGKFR